MRILFVEDEADIREIVSLALGLDKELELRCAASGAEALTLLGETDWRPDLLLVDVAMPGMSGPEFVARFREELPSLSSAPVVFLTASAMASEVAEFRRLGTAVITKPFNPMLLATEVRGFARP